MSERAHPDDPGFGDKWVFCLRRGFIPWLRPTKNPYKYAFYWRYKWVGSCCSGKDVLDVPCGMGWGTALIRGARTLVGVDLSAEAIAEARRRYGKIAQFSTGDMGCLDFADGSFDVVSCLEGIEHVPLETGHRFLKESERVLRPGGLLLLSSPYCRTTAHSGNPYHLHEYQPEEIKALVSQRFEIEDIVTRDVDILTILYMRCRRKLHG
ncbi:MAG: methyltransferase domain-containing protein [Gammaproteobacteria bacterium]